MRMGDGDIQRFAIHQFHCSSQRILNKGCSGANQKCSFGMRLERFAQGRVAAAFVFAARIIQMLPGNA